MDDRYVTSQEINLDRIRLLQDRTLEQVLQNPGELDLITVYLRVENGDGMFSLDKLIYPALFGGDDVDQLLSDKSINDYEADAVINRPKIWNNRYNKSDSIVSLDTSGRIQVTNNIIDFHQLRHNSDASEYFKVDNEGNKETIIRIRSDEVLMRYAELRDFLAAKGMCLSLLFEFNEYSDRSVTELSLNTMENSEVLGLDRCRVRSDGIYGAFQRDNSTCWHFHHADTPYTKFNSNSRLRGRKIILPQKL